MSSEIAISAQGVGKKYNIFRKPEDRLKQMLSFGQRKYYAEYWALQNVSFEVKRGETIGILGRNGAGKSTLLQMICGILTPTTGSVQVNGRVAALLELGAGFNPEFTGRENVFLSATILGLDRSQVAERFEAIAEFAGIGDFMEQPVKLYSSGMYARLAFAVAAHVDADILVIDEILAVGDAAFTQKCMRFINKFKEHGSILFVSHDTSSITNLCDRAIWIDKGEMRAEGSAKDIAFSYIASLYGDGEGDGFQIGGARKADVTQGRKVEDPRRELLDNSTMRNEIEVFDFDPESPWFGNRGATIQNARLLSTDGHELPVVVGGDEIVLEVTAEAHVDLDRPILGFYIKDKLGQNLFGDNTFLTYASAPVPARAGALLTAHFRFQMPYLPAGDYSVNVAIANGTQSTHVQHHWMDDARFFRVAASHFTKGIVGIPMLDIELSVA
ncbi:ABC transporter ATP-binding protein [uncultured Hyphomonas sp.]|uniref:ABC transporter ATP-binding protein n=1 Tax=uncultured Hyphomonas sp. TaxID=225298 RepID=UPI002AAC0A4B|nr:ABC transporter ATP-binding protein [uncultured Hyphomonas sp.]